MARLPPEATKPDRSVMKLIAGLGNPDAEYARTRHNVGFMIVEALAARHGISGPKTKFHAQVVEGTIAEQRVMLMQPTTYMNRSGLAVGEAAAFYKLEPDQVMVVVDDTALPLGHLRLRGAGSCGGHNGLADIERALGSDRYARLRFGIGAPRTADGHPIPQRDYVLTRFTADQQKEIEPSMDAACDALACWLTDGIDLAMTRYNTPARRDPPASDDADNEEPPSKQGD